VGLQGMSAEILNQKRVAWNFEATLSAGEWRHP
jgi:hypothetical protein